MPLLQTAAKRDADEAKEILELFSGPKDAKRLMELPPDELFVSFVQGVTANVPELKRVLTASEFQIIGTVHEKDGTAHLVYRGKLKAGEAAISKVDVISLKRDKGSWRMLLRQDMKELSQQLPGALDER